MSKYIYDPTLEDEHKRLHALEDALDPGTIRVLETIGIERTWRCLEVGGGGGSIAYWLSQHADVVVATDIDTRFLERVPASNIEVRKHNIVTDPIEEAAYDLVHSRDVLEHIPERELVLDRMVAALKPGGWLVAEDVDFTSALRLDGFGEMDDDMQFEGTTWEAAARAMRARGIDAEYGRRLPWRLRARGLTDVSAEVRAGFIRAGTPTCQLYALSMKQLRPLMLEGGLSEEDFQRLLNLIAHDDFMGFGPVHVAAWGRKPA